ncbi:phosphotransferase [Allosaccharopolyspora coralli]|uniref:Phosphotransferase n=1 Tax=Allosaccharopolyspora coralli TaxID=2665642 RepID=A0A5Q3Q690_9PSEU|nr:fructosamine kinase family protein [Allosaccharopolyspora coralli]QGK69360.1 phosphotransferase [Allosaccharopolyspora coralli]
MNAEDAVVALTGSATAGERRLTGGDTSAAFEVRCSNGETVFVKRTDGMPGAVPAEAASLRWLANSGTVPVPAVHGHDEHWLVTDHVASGRPSSTAAETFGRQLATLHASGADGFGAPPPDGPADAWIGLAPMRNEVKSDWPTFYATHRVEPYVRRATDQGVLSGTKGDTIMRVCARLDDLAGPAEPPARLHGDLWSGNVHWGSDDRVWLIDPAAHGGHRETDIAMLHLFGCPHLERIVAAYEEVTPLADGWRARIGLHQLFPLLVHTVLFGRGYGMQAVSAARDALTEG